MPFVLQLLIPRNSWPFGMLLVRVADFGIVGGSSVSEIFDNHMSWPSLMLSTASIGLSLWLLCRVTLAVFALVSCPYTVGFLSSAHPQSIFAVPRPVP